VLKDVRTFFSSYVVRKRTTSEFSPVGIHRRSTRFVGRPGLLVFIVLAVVAGWYLGKSQCPLY